MNGQLDIGGQIRYHRRRKGLSQEKVALRANITTAYLGQIERSKKNPTVCIVRRIADAMQISVIELLQSTSYNELSRDPVIDRILFELDGMSDSGRKAALNIICQLRQAILTEKNEAGPVASQQGE
jgi:transcriptional regulator with XRE-family HTH domain